MTIHKSKGLEFPVVIYPEAIISLDEKLNASKAAEEWLCPEDLGFEAIPNLDKVLFKLDKNAENMGNLAAQKVEKENESNRLDNLNLLYVAFTRAVQRLYVIAKQGKEKQSNILRDFLTDMENHQVSGNDALIYHFGDPDFRNPKEETNDDTDETMTDSVASDWLRKIKVDANPTLCWQSENDAMQPREWGELVHQILAKIRNIEEADSVLLPYLHEGVIDLKTAGALKDKFLQMAQHPLISGAFRSDAKVKTECEIYYPAIKKVIRLDRYAELPDAIYLLDYKTGKKDPDHHEQVRHYANAVKALSDKEIRSYLVYLAADTIEVEAIMVNAQQ